MSRVPSKHSRDQALNFQGFLNDLQDWELSLKDRDKKLKQQIPPEGESINYDALSRMSGKLMEVEEDSPVVDANTEKESGNEYFKQKKFREAIDCYSRSIALSPSAVAFANRAMAYLKIKRFQEAEEDCTDALNLDDRYIKAYSRRATARKELGKLKESLDDAEFAARLEPHNQEVKKQFNETKSLLQKTVLNSASQAQKRSGDLKIAGKKTETNGNAKSIHPVPKSNKNAGIALIPDKQKKRASEQLGGKDKVDETKANGQQVNQLHDNAANNSPLNNRAKKQGLGPSVQEVASRAASRTMMESARNINPPNSAYQFEVYWKAFSGDLSLQVRLLKVTQPDGLPQIFRNSLSTSILIDIIKCLASYYREETDLAIRYLENLTKVSRFDILIMCLPNTEKSGLCRIWDEVFLSKDTPIEYLEVLNDLHPKYCPRRGVPNTL